MPAKLSSYLKPENYQSNNDNKVVAQEALTLAACFNLFSDYAKLATRFAELKDSESFIIATTRFNHGVFFLHILKLWQAIVKNKASLFFIAFEEYPISTQELGQTVNYFPNLTKEAELLLTQYYLPLPATHRLSFPQNAYLNLIIGQLATTLPNQNFQADVWLLDKQEFNKELCFLKDQAFMRQMVKLTKAKASCIVIAEDQDSANDLSQYGFQIIKNERQNSQTIIVGYRSAYVSNPIPVKTRMGANKPTPWFDNYINQNREKKVLIIGGGISGAATAYSLAKRGYQVILYEKNSTLASEASGNYQGILYGSFSGNYTPMLELSFSGYRYSHYLISSLLEPNKEYQNCGMLQLAANSSQLKQQQQILAKNFPAELCYLVEQEQINLLAGIPLKCDSGLFFPLGLWLNPPSLVHKLCAHPNITVRLNTEISSLNRTSTKWQLETANGVIDHADNVVICNAHALTKFSPLATLSLRKIRGQTSLINNNLGLKTVVCGGSYITPNLGEYFTLGASFKFGDNDLSIKIEEHEENIRNLITVIPDLAEEINWQTIQGQANFRASTTDYLPLVGPIADHTKFIQAYQLLAKDANYWIETPCPYLPGLFINAAHGAKGLLTAPICGEIIADYIANTPSAGSESLRCALHPNRFWLKQIIKKGYC
jgi:tRNA 5-methylaminomethyl-2-thiouridine biosynthesis bifunctional protein